MTMNLTVLSVLFGGLSGAFWLASAFVKLPSDIWFQAGVGGGGRNEKFEKLVGQLKLQSRLNAWAAFFASIVAVIQVWSAYHQG